MNNYMNFVFIVSVAAFNRKILIIIFRESTLKAGICGVNATVRRAAFAARAEGSFRRVRG
ncbi:MAG TPA: hypothetical protein VJ001_08345 [Rhodocyclaceae bacterium]|nr:hypothetical protein [Rhodocyclaceae bacterium]